MPSGGTKKDTQVRSPGDEKGRPKAKGRGLRSRIARTLRTGKGDEKDSDAPPLPPSGEGDDYSSESDSGSSPDDVTGESVSSPSTHQSVDAERSDSLGHGDEGTSRTAQTSSGLGAEGKEEAVGPDSDKEVQAEKDDEPVPDRLPGKQRFVNYFFSVGIAAEMRPMETHSPSARAIERPYNGDLLELFPRENKVDPFPEHVWLFCFPDGVRLQRSVDRPRSSTFPFVLTTITGDKLFGQALNVFEPLSSDCLARIADDSPPSQGEEEQTVWTPRCLCLLSYYPFFSAFRSWLSEFHARSTTLKLPLPIEEYITEIVMRVPLPPPRSSVVVEFSMHDKWFTAARSPPEFFEDESIPMGMLFKVLSLNNVLTVLRAILMEERVLLVSERMTLLTYAAETLRLLLYPFHWPHVYIPILPESLVEFAAYTPLPFIIGVKSTTLPKILSNSEASPEIFVVDLDNNSVTVPVPLQKLPEPEFSVLHRDMRAYLFEDVDALDNPAISLLRHTRSSTEEIKHANGHIVSAFRRFFASMLRDYRSYLMYLRVFPEPVAMFDTEKFIAARCAKAASSDQSNQGKSGEDRAGGASTEELRNFFESLLETQAFQVFLEEHNWPEPNMFDTMIDEQLYEAPFSEILSRVSLFHAPVKMRPDTFPGGRLRVERIRVEPRHKKLPGGPFSYSSFPRLNQDILRAGESLKPIPVGVSDPPKASKSLNKPNFDDQGAEMPVSSESKAVKKAIEQLLSGVPEQEQGPPLSSEDVAELVAVFRTAAGRRNFAYELGSHVGIEDSASLPTSGNSGVFSTRSSGALDTAPTSRVAQLSGPAFDQLCAIICSCLRTATEANDALLPRDLLRPIFAFHKLSMGAEVFLYAETAIRDLEQWQSLDFWESAFFSSLSARHANRYGNIQHRMQRWVSVKEEKRQEVTERELDVVFDLACKFVFYQVQLGVSVDLIRKLLSRSTSWTALDSEKIQLLNQMASNMITANELMTADLPDEDTQLDTLTPEGHFVLVGGRNEGGRLHGEAIQAEQHELLQGFIQEGSRTSTMSKVRATLTPLFSARRRKVADPWLMHNLDHREGYTVKTLRGHSQAVLTVALAQPGTAVDGTIDRVFSGSCDSTIRVWNAADSQCLTTLQGHSGWVNCLALDHEKVVSGSYDSTVKLWDANKGAKLRTLRGHEGAISALSITSDAILHIVSGSYDNSLRVWDPRHPKRPVQTLLGHAGAISCLSSQGARVLSGSRDGSLRLWDLRSARALSVLQGHSDWLSCCMFVDDDTAVSGSSDTTARVWRGLRSGKPKKVSSLELRGHQAPLTTVQVRESSLMTTSSDGFMKLWDLKSGSELAQHRVHVDEVSASADIPSSRSGMFMTGSADCQAKLWNVDTAAEADAGAPKISHAYTLTGHRGKITCAAVADNRIVTGSWDCTARLWEFDRKVL